MLQSKRNLIWPLILALLLAAGCAKNVRLHQQAAKEFKKGLFEQSLDSSVRSLELKPGYAKAQKLIKQSYPKAVAAREAQIRQLDATGKPDRWDLIVPHYRALLEIQNKVAVFDSLYDKKSGQSYRFEQKDYASQLHEALQRASEYHYARGTDIAASDTYPDVQREAVAEFELTQTFIRDYKQVVPKLAAARKAAVKRVAIMAFADRSGSEGRYGGVVDLLTEAIIGKLVRDPEAMRYLEIVTRDQIDAILAEQQLTAPDLTEADNAVSLGARLGVHEILTGKVIQINYIPPRVTSTDLKETATIEEKQEYTTESGKKKTKKVKTEISCDYRKYTKTASVKIIASFSMVEVGTGRVKLQNTETAEFPWTGEWGRVLGGDERALKRETKDFCAREEPWPPTETELVNSALGVLSGSIAAKVRDYVK